MNQQHWCLQWMLQFECQAALFITEIPILLWIASLLKPSYLRTEFLIGINIAGRGDSHKPSHHGVHIKRSRNVLSLSVTLHWSADTEWRYLLNYCTRQKPCHAAHYSNTEWRYLLYEATRLFIVIVNSEPLKLYTTAVCNRLFSFLSHSRINFTTVLYSIFNRLYMNTHCVINMCHTPNL